MKIKLIDFGFKKDHYPFRPHENDAAPMCICLITAHKAREVQEFP